MPVVTPDLLDTIEKTAVHVALEPAHNCLYSLLLLHKCHDWPDLDPWVTETIGSLSSDRVQMHQLVVEGVHYALVTDQSFPSFPAYIDYLAQEDPLVLRERTLAAYASMRLQSEPKSQFCHPDPFAPLTVDANAILASLDAYLDFLYARFEPDNINVAIEEEAYRLLLDPPMMRSLIVSHLQTMWAEVLAEEWQRVLPSLENSVAALQQVDLQGRTPLEAVRLVADRPLAGKWQQALEETDADEIILVPSAHVGSHLGVKYANKKMWIFFGAYVPQTAPTHEPERTRTDLLVRLNALADDTRLRILLLLSEEGELCSQDVMRRLALSQSAVSRHLKRLSATGYLSERRREGAKCYRLNTERIEKTLAALERMLLSS